MRICMEKSGTKKEIIRFEAEKDREKAEVKMEKVGKGQSCIK